MHESNDPADITSKLPKSRNQINPLSQGDELTTTINYSSAITTPMRPRIGEEGGFNSACNSEPKIQELSSQEQIGIG